MIGAKKPKILWAIVTRIAVNMIDLQWNATGHRISFAPAAHVAAEAAGLHEVPANVY